MAKKRVLLKIDLPEGYHSKLKEMCKNRHIKDACRSMLIAMVENEIETPERVKKHFKNA